MVVLKARSQMSVYEHFRRAGSCYTWKTKSKTSWWVGCFGIEKHVPHLRIVTWHDTDKDVNYVVKLTIYWPMMSCTDCNLSHVCLHCILSAFPWFYLWCKMLYKKIWQLCDLISIVFRTTSRESYLRFENGIAQSILSWRYITWVCAYVHANISTVSVWNSSTQSSVDCSLYTMPKGELIKV